MGHTHNTSRPVPIAPTARRDLTAGLGDSLNERPHAPHHRPGTRATGTENENLLSRNGHSGYAVCSMSAV